MSNILSRISLKGIAATIILVGVPLLGCYLAVHFQNMWWLVLLLPFMAFHEGGILLIAVAVVYVAWMLS